MFPRPQVQLAFGDCHHDFTSHDLPFVVRVGVVFASAVVQAAAAGRVGAGVEGNKVFQPAVVVLVQAAFIVIDEHTGGDVHRVRKHIV